MSTRRTLLKAAGVTAGVVGGAAASAYAAERAALGALRRRPDPDAGHLDQLTFDEARRLPSHDDASIYTVSRGTGPPVLFSHGVTISSRVWVKQFRDLPDHGVRVLAFDHRGHGESMLGSRATRSPTSPRTCGSSSTGSTCATPSWSDTRWVAWRSRRSRSPIPTCGRTGPGHRAALDPRQDQRVDVPAAAMVRRAGDQPLRPAPVDAPPEPRDALRPGRLRAVPPGQLGRAQPRDARQLRVGHRPRRDRRAARPRSHRPAAGLDIPTLVIGGTADVITPPAESRRLAAAIPGARLVLLTGAGHNIMLERTDEFHELMLDFARELGLLPAAAGVA